MTEETEVGPKAGEYFTWGQQRERIVDVFAKHPRGRWTVIWEDDQGRPCYTLVRRGADGWEWTA